MTVEELTCHQITMTQQFYKFFGGSVPNMVSTGTMGKWAKVTYVEGTKDG